MLVEESIRVANQDSWMVDIRGQSFFLIKFWFDIDWLTRRGKEHAVKVEVFWMRFNPEMSAIEVLLKHETHLIKSTKDILKEEIASSFATTALHRVQSLIHCHFELFYDLF